MLYFINQSMGIFLDVDNFIVFIARWRLKPSLTTVDIS
jgi:hypothetical protein